MGMVKKEFIEYETGLESMEAGLEWMTKYGVKTFKDYTGEWVEVRCSRIAVLESDLDGARRTKWELVNKIKLLENNAAFECVEKGEALTLHEKINIIKEGFTL